MLYITTNYTLQTLGGEQHNICYADGNALVYEYQFTDEYDLSDEAEKQSVQDALKEGCEENASTFEDIADTLESEVGLSGVHVRLVYLNGDGSEIYTHDFE